tara:strand:+ start:285 stop:950 length:666 start_codon:yes stop_codon:yes gene_type:complete
MQRFFDIIFSGIALIFLLPIFIPVIIILRFTGENEVFFFQERVGKEDSRIKLFKFVTMLKNSENMGSGTITLKNDSRVLPFGKILRKTKLNELPQLINVLNGDMSIIGPRPQTQRCFNAFPTSSQKEILKVRPGLSGIGSIIFRNEEEMMEESSNPDEFYDSVIMPYKGILECWYVKNKNIITFFIFIILTILVILHPNNRLIWKIYPSLPKIPIDLEKYL